MKMQLKSLAIVFIFLVTQLVFCNRGTVYVVPFFAFYTPEQFFNPDARDGCQQCYCDLKDALECLGYRVELVVEDTVIVDPVHILAFNMPEDEKIYNKLLPFAPEKKSLFIWEPPMVLYQNFDPERQAQFGRIYTWYDNLIDGKKFFKFFFPQPRLKMIDDTIDFNYKKFCTVIAGHKSWEGEGSLYEARKKTIRYFQTFHPDDFDLYGQGWPEEYTSYRGGVEKKRDCLKHYKFCICYENYHQYGSITEKIFDCFVAGCVPVYWGAKNIEQYIPANCYIKREDFSSHEQLYQYLKSISREQYQEYMDNIRRYLASCAAAPFSIDAFIATALTPLMSEVV